MARAATWEELALFRSPGQFSKIRSAIFPPTTIYTARVNQSFSSLDKLLEIIYDTGSGTLANVLDGMTLLIGSTAGAWDKGIARVRAMDATKVYIGEAADLRVADNDYLTVVDDFGLWARPILISDGTPYMDGGVVYDDQHTNFLPLLRMGPNRVVKKTGSTVTIEFDFSDSIVPGSSVSSRSTSAPGALSVFGGTTSSPEVTWDSVGWFKVYHVVTGANGKSDFGVRYVFIWDETNEPEPVQYGGRRADVDSGGWELSLTLFDQANLTQVRDHALILVFSEDYYEGEETEIGPVAGAENILFSGWIAGESIEWKSEGGEVSFRAYTAHYFLQKIPAWPDGIEFTTATPDRWTQMKNLTVDLGLIHHFLMWRSTAPRIMDIYGTDDSRFSKEVSSLASNLWSQIQEMAFDQIFARPLVNCLNQLYIEIHPQLIPEADRDFPEVMTFEKQDLEDDIRIDRATMDNASIVDLSGIAINSSGSGTPYFSLSPGHSHSHYGSPIVVSRILLASQTQANQLAGLYRGWQNNPFEPIELRLAAINRLIDICPLQKCQITIDSGDTIRGISETLGLIPSQIEESFDARSGYPSLEITFEAETFEDLSTTGDFPGSGDVSIPPTPSFPPLPDFDPIFPGTGTGGEEEGSSTVLLHDTNVGLIYTTSFDEASPVWQTGNAGLTTAQAQGIIQIEITPSGAVWVVSQVSSAYVEPTNGKKIFRAPYIGGTFVEVIGWDFMSSEYPSANWNNPDGNRFIAGFGVNRLVPEEVGFIGGGNNFGLFTSDVNLWVGNGSGFTKKGACNNVNFFHGSLSYGFGKWVFTGEEFTFIATFNNRLWRFASGGGSVEHEIGLSTPIGAPAQHVRPSTDQQLYIYGVAFSYSDDNGTTITDINPSGLQYAYRPAVDPTGQYLMSVWDTGERGKSSDFGYTWVGIPALAFGGPYAFCYGGGTGTASRWIAARGTGGPYESTNFGVSWVAKPGNLTAIAPTPLIDIVKVPGV